MWSIAVITAPWEDATLMASTLACKFHDKLEASKTAFSTGVRVNNGLKLSKKKTKKKTRKNMTDRRVRFFFLIIKFFFLDWTLVFFQIGPIFTWESVYSLMDCQPSENLDRKKKKFLLTHFSVSLKYGKS